MANLATAERLRSACDVIGPASEWPREQAEWVAKVADTIAWVRAADDVATRATYEFQWRLWEENHIALPGQGNIAVDRVLQDATFREWIAEASVATTAAGATQDAVTAFYEELLRQLKVRFAAAKMPRLKALRVVAALFPDEMTTIAKVSAVRKLAGQMGLESPTMAHPIACHVFIRRRLESAIGPVDRSDARRLAERMTLPWMLYARTSEFSQLNRASTAATPGAAEPTASGQDGTPEPLPAARRRRGLTAIGGMFQTVLSALEFLRNGATRHELIAFLRTGSPELKNDSLAVIINALVSEFGVIKSDGSRYLLTASGELVLETQDSIHLADWMLRRVLGVDLAVATLRDHGAIPRAQLIAAVRAANPGWTTDYTPQAIVNWLRAFGVIVSDGHSGLSLTDVGRKWAERITWQPELLPRDSEAESVGLTAALGMVGDGVTVQLPSQGDIVDAVSKKGHFEPQQIAHLHASLWGHPRRHFAILTGLSGSGKTLLARSYAEALTSRGTLGRMHTVAVQPGWYDASALLGFQNPLRGGSYVRTGFLDFLIAAANDPTQPHVVVLDEMNLSHPEQYMAPLLSAMETGDVIPVHNDSALASIVPAAIPYPHNLAIIGTMNTDETTHGLSDKVLDRAFVHEFWDVDLEAYPRWATRSRLDSAQETMVRDLLRGLMSALAPARRHFGWRVVDDTLDYLCLAIDGPHGLSLTAALDSVVYAKVLPKLRGDDSAKFQGALAACDAVLTQFGLMRSKAKLEDLKRELDATGSAQFWR